MDRMGHMVRMEWSVIKCFSIVGTVFRTPNVKRKLNTKRSSSSYRQIIPVFVSPMQLACLLRVVFPIFQ